MNLPKCLFNIFRAIVPLCLCVFVFISPAHAHKVKIFASVEADIISGYGYYTSSARAKNVAVNFIGPDGNTFQRIKTDDKGEFEVKARYRTDTLISLSTGDGHGAKWLITADEFPADLPGYPLANGEDSAVDIPGENAAPSHVHAAKQQPSDGAAEIIPLLRRELRPLQEQINQLRAQIDLQEEKKQFQDILGAIGYILGLTGIGFYIAAKRRRGRG